MTDSNFKKGLKHLKHITTLRIMSGDRWQLWCTNERGTMMRKGPLSLLCSIRYVMSAMVWMVLPSPISSARIPFRLLLYRDTIHSRPWICKTWKNMCKDICALKITGSGRDDNIWPTSIKPARTMCIVEYYNGNMTESLRRSLLVQSKIDQLRL